MERKNAWKGYDEAKSAKVDALAKDYMDFLDNGKTERECVDTIVNQIEAAGYRELPELMKEGKKLSAGDKVYAVWMNKTVVMFQIGTKPMTEGLNILGAHIDSPRLDIKQNPLYEDSDFALLDTHYYGGIKKYQWVTLPLALHGVVAKKDGSIVEINIGENEDDPVFFISDLLIHLSAEQMEKKASKVIEGEALDLIFGSRPLAGEEKEAVKAGVMKLLAEQYGIEEEDFLSAELEVVPAGKAREAGLDRSMVLGYGQDDRVCAYTALQAILKCKDPKKTCMTILTDKEETGSDGNTGLNSSYLPYFIADLAKVYGLEGRNVISASECLSADVNAAYDPTFSEPFEIRNSSQINYGVVATKFTGARGKSGTSDASAEFVGRVRKLFDEHNIVWQTGELGKVDGGGGGTVAQYIANLDMNVIDVGVPVLSMHAPFEITSKIDTYMAYKAFSVFFAD